MKCPVCDGIGQVDNPRYYRHSASWSWEHDIPTRITCKKCKGIGFIIGNMADIVERLKCAANGVTITTREAKQMYEAIAKYQHMTNKKKYIKNEKCNPTNTDWVVFVLSPDYFAFG